MILDDWPVLRLALLVLVTLFLAVRRRQRA